MSETIDLSAKFEIQLDVCGKCGWRGFIDELEPKQLEPVKKVKIEAPISNSPDAVLGLELFLTTEVVRCPTCGQILRIVVKGSTPKGHLNWHEQHDMIVPTVGIGK